MLILSLFIPWAIAQRHSPLLFWVQYLASSPRSPVILNLVTLARKACGRHTQWRIVCSLSERGFEDPLCDEWPQASPIYHWFARPGGSSFMGLLQLLSPSRWVCQPESLPGLKYMTTLALLVLAISLVALSLLPVGADVPSISA